MQKIANKQTVARLFGVHGATIMRWVRENRFPSPFTLVPHGRVFFDMDEIEAHLVTRRQAISMEDSQ